MFSANLFSFSSVIWARTLLRGLLVTTKRARTSAGGNVKQDNDES